MSEQESEYVKLISSDGFEFIIHREAAMRSGTIKNMLSGAGTYSLAQSSPASQQSRLLSSQQTLPNR